MTKCGSCGHEICPDEGVVRCGICQCLCHEDCVSMPDGEHWMCRSCALDWEMEQNPDDFRDIYQEWKDSELIL